MVIGVVDFAVRNGGVEALEQGRLTRVAHGHTVFPPGWFDDREIGCGAACRAAPADAPRAPQA
jgi:hypothetical protein